MFFARHESGRGGLEWCFEARDLKTAKGVIARIKRNPNLAPGVWEVIRYNTAKPYDESEFRVVAKTIVDKTEQNAIYHSIAK